MSMPRSSKSDSTTSPYPLVPSSDSDPPSPNLQDAVDVVLVPLGMAAEVVVIVEHEDLLVPPSLLLEESRLPRDR